MLTFQHGWIHKFKQSGEQRLVCNPAVLGKADHDRVVVSMKNFASYSKVCACALCLCVGSFCFLRLPSLLGRVRFSGDYLQVMRKDGVFNQPSAR